MSLLQEILRYLRALDLTGAVLGAVVSGIFAGSYKTASAVWNRRPLRRFLGDYADNNKAVSIFVRDMVSPDGTYISRDPTGEARWQNFHVVGRPDVEVATDVVTLLGQVGRTGNIVWRQIEKDWALWTEPIISVGGSFKTDKILELCSPHLVQFKPPQTFITVGDNKHFDISDGYDYGLIYRGMHPQTGVPCIVLFGFGSAGTEATGAFLRRNAKELGRLYGSRAFAAIVRVGTGDGRESGKLVWLSPGVSRLAPVLHFHTWFRNRKVIAARRISPPTSA